MMLMLMVTPFSVEQSLPEHFQLVGGACRTTQAVEAPIQSQDAPDVTREYKRFADVIEETIDAPIHQGSHFRTADIHRAKIGKDVARCFDKHYFQPVK